MVENCDGGDCRCRDLEGNGGAGGGRWKTISRNAARCCVAFLMGIFLCSRALLAGVLGLPGKREGAGLAVDLVRWNGGANAKYILS